MKLQKRANRSFVLDGAPNINFGAKPSIAKKNRQIKLASQLECRYINVVFFISAKVCFGDKNKCILWFQI